MYDRAVLQLARIKENEDKHKDDVERISVELEMMRERYVQLTRVPTFPVLRFTVTGWVTTTH